MDNYQKTFETWDKVAALYQCKFMDLDLYNDSYLKFCELVNKTNATIFEIGCGPGNITKHLIASRQDFQIYAIDASPNMIQLAKANNPTANFSIMDCREIGSLTLTFDGIISGFCMPYLAKEDNSQFIRNCATLLESGGIFYFSTILGNYNDSGFVAASTGDQSYVYYYEEEYLQNELVKNNFETIEIIYKQSPVPVANTMGDIIFIAKKK